MDLWIDNTGLQSAGLCLEGKARDEDDVRGLLQLATLIVFGRVRLNGFEHEQVRRGSESVLARLRSVGIPADVIDLENVQQDTYADACLKAALHAAQELERGFVISGSNPFSSLEPPELPRGTRERQEAFVELLDQSVSDLRKTAESALSERAMGAVDFMVSSSPSLRAQLAQLDLRCQRPYQINVYLRFCLNEALGRHFRSTYAPSVARAELVERNATSILDALGEETSNIVSEYRDRFSHCALDIPTVWAFLLHKAKGDPESVLIEASSLRSETKLLRSALSAMDNSMKSGDLRSEFDQRNTVRDLADQMRARLDPSEQTGVLDAISVKLSPTTGSVGLSLGEIKKWYSKQRQKPLIVALTDVVKVAVMYMDAHEDYNTLLKKARRHV